VTVICSNVPFIIIIITYHYQVETTVGPFVVKAQYFLINVWIVCMQCPADGLSEFSGCTDMLIYRRVSFIIITYQYRVETIVGTICC